MGLKTIILVILIHTICQTSGVDLLKKSYDKGVKAYFKERWSECIKQFEESLHLYKLYKSTLVNCRLKCNSMQFKSQMQEKIGDLAIYEIYFNRKDCLDKCYATDFKSIDYFKDIDDTIVSNMQARKPYEYLHICYFQMNALQKAASAAYTYSIGNPDDHAMQANLKYYMLLPEIDVKEIIDFLSEDYMVLYKLGLNEYNKNNWAETAANMEEVLSNYISSENICRVECEKQPEQQWSPEFSIGISNNIAALLHCQQQCQDRLKSLHYDSGFEFLADVLNYIQISYYRLDRFVDAGKAVATILMIFPEHEDMLKNLRIYSNIADPILFLPRSDIAHYFQRDVNEKKLLNIFHKGDDRTEADPNSV